MIEAVPLWTFRFLGLMDLGSPVDSVCPDCSSRSFFVGIRDLDDGLVSYYAHCGRCEFRLKIDREKREVEPFDFDFFMDTI